jgi:1-acyl-sn-glycerol-3-phosphate acyltransferase
METTTSPLEHTPTHGDPEIGAMPYGVPWPGLERADVDPNEVSSGWTFQQWLTHQPGKLERFLRKTSYLWDFFFRMRWYGIENEPQTGPFLFLGNHSSFLDGIWQVRPLKRRVRFMAKSTAFDNKALRAFMIAGGGFPVRRGTGDNYSLELTRRYLEQGDPVGIYMEGTRYRDEDALGKPRSGAARLALEMRVPMFPVVTYGGKPRTTRGKRFKMGGTPKITTLYGEPFDFTTLEPTRENIAYVREAVWAESRRLYDLARELNNTGRPRDWKIPPRERVAGER